MQSAVIFTGGTVHPFESSAPALAAVLAEAGFRTRVSFRLDEALEWLRQDAAALFVVYALRWTMTQHEKYAAERERWGLRLAPAAQAAIRRHVQDGAGLLGVHTASICFDDWPEWRQLLGGAWQWERSWHPPLGAVEVQPDQNHVLTRGLPAFTVTDEVYSDLALATGIEVGAVAQAQHAARSTGWQPVLWAHRYGRGRVVCDLLGHDAASIEHPVHRQILQRAARWASEQSPQIAEAV